METGGYASRFSLEYDLHMARSAHMDYQAKLRTPFGMLGISCNDGALTGIAFLALGEKPQAPRTAMARNVCEQLNAYFADPGFRFSLPLSAGGTPHQNKVWAAMCAIPHGKTRSYGDIAAQLHSSPLAVGQACGANPIPVVIPCHRIVGRSGLGGFANHRDGHLLDIKRWLLRHEGAI